MNDLFPDDVADLDVQIREVRRELEQRAVTYPRLIAAGRLKPGMATKRTEVMRAVLRTLEALRDAREGDA